MRIHYRLQQPLALDATLDLHGFTVLFGRSGSGKSSLLKAIAGLLQAQGEPWDGWPAQRRPVGYLPQDSGLFPHLRVWQNVAFALDGSRAARRARALRLLDDVGLAALADRWPAQISSGQQQRVALMRALVRLPQLLLLDEPTAALDALTRDEVMADLIDNIHRSGVPALAASHDPHLAALADGVALLVDGRVVQQGTPAEVFSRPASAAAAQLLGIRNVYTATVLARYGAQWELDCGGMRLHATGPTDLCTVKAVGVVIPAEAVTADGVGDGVPMTVIRLRHEGQSVRLWLKGAATPTVEALSPLGAGNPRLGDTLRMRVVPSRVHLFSLNTDPIVPSLAGAPGNWPRATAH